ncbi:MAG: hypothetical protein IPN89_14790 [Saprospiraceae bacterium]|nr:hypothetical protein [Saprospiraceae bacterium]
MILLITSLSISAQKVSHPKAMLLLSSIASTGTSVDAELYKGLKGEI